MGRNWLNPSVGDPSGEGLTVSEPVLPDGAREEGDPEIDSSEFNAVVAIALAGPAVPANGILPLENLDEEDIREALDPGRPGNGTPARGGDITCAFDGRIRGEAEGWRGSGEATGEGCRGEDAGGEGKGCFSGVDIVGDDAARTTPDSSTGA